MKTRIIKTRYWVDSTIHSLSIEARYYYLYLLTSQHINLCGIFELPDAYIQLETGLSAEQLQEAKKALTKAKKVYFHEDWIYVINADKHNNYRNSPRTEVAYQRELVSVPGKVKSYFDSTIDSTIYSTPNTKTIIPKPETLSISKGSKVVEELRKKFKDKY